MRIWQIGRKGRTGKRGRPMGSGLNDHMLLIHLAMCVHDGLRPPETTYRDFGLNRPPRNPTKTSLRALSRLVAQGAPGHDLKSTADRLRRKFRSVGDQYLKMIQDHDNIRGTEVESNFEAINKDFNEKSRRLDALLIKDPELNSIVRFEPLEAGELYYHLPDILDQLAPGWIQSSPKLGRKLG